MLPKVITRIEGWHERFFYVQDSIIPAKYPQLLSEQNKLDSKSFKDKLPLNIKENPMFQRLGRYPTSVRMFPDPILFLVGLKPSWEYGQQRPTIMASGKEMDFRNFIYTEDDEDLSFLPKEPSLGFGTGSLSVIEKLRGEFDVMRSRERAREEECEGLRVKCEAAMTEFEKNPVVVALQEKIYALSTEVKEHKLNLDKMMLTSQIWAGYQQSLSTLESKVTSLEAEKARLEVVEVSLRKEVEELKQDRREVVSKVVPYAAMELVYSDDMVSLVGRFVSSVILYGRCRAYDQVADMKEPFDLSKVKGYRSSYKNDHTQARNDFSTATFPWLDEFVADPSTPIEVLLSKKPPSLQRHVPSRTQVPLPTSQRATPSSTLVSNTMSPPADASVAKL
ncbi:hypothetical protein Tco_1214191 [Tanacetum coccineum]